MPSCTAVNATLWLYLDAFLDEDNDGYDYIAAVVNTTQASVNSLVAADYDNAGSISSPVLASYKRDLTGSDPNSWINLTFTASGINAINNADEMIMIGLKEGHDIENASINTDNRNYAVINMSETAGYAPFLSVNCDSGIITTNPTATITLSGPSLTFYGDRNITIKSSSEASSISKLAIVRYSKYLTHLPNALLDFEILPSTLTDKNLSPYGQTNQQGWFNFEGLRTDDRIDIYIKQNQSFPTDCVNVTICDRYNQTGSCVWINSTDGQRVAANVTSTSNTSAFVFVNLNCSTADVTGLMDTEFNFTIEAMCANYSKCVQSVGWDS
jgi:hypothetical protein